MDLFFLRDLSTLKISSKGDNKTDLRIINPVRSKRPSELKWKKISYQVWRLEMETCLIRASSLAIEISRWRLLARQVQLDQKQQSHWHSQISLLHLQQATHASLVQWVAMSEYHLRLSQSQRVVDRS
jgi:hypothetical protein